MSRPSLSPKERLIVALDVPDEERALALVDTLIGSVGMFKVGMELFTAAGPQVVTKIRQRGGAVFLDLKFHDIPNTVQGAVESATRLGVSLLTIHGLGGASMIAAAAEGARGSDTRLLAVTILTSHDRASLSQVGITGGLTEQVVSLASLAGISGADGVIASPQEILDVREVCGPNFLIVTPGIRPVGTAVGDQARVATPRSAIEAGADYIVVGRPITKASDRAAAARAIVEDMARARGSMPPAAGA